MLKNINIKKYIASPLGLFIWFGSLAGMVILFDLYIDILKNNIVLLHININNFFEINDIIITLLSIILSLLIYALFIKATAVTLLLILVLYVLTACYLIMQMGVLQYLGFSILLSYIGGILILFTFFIMMVYPRIKNNITFWPIQYWLLLVFSCLLVINFFSIFFELSNINLTSIKNGGIKDVILIKQVIKGEPEQLFDFFLELYSTNFIYLIIIGIILIVGTIGCVILLSRKIENTKHQDVSEQMLVKRKLRI